MDDPIDRLRFEEPSGLIVEAEAGHVRFGGCLIEPEAPRCPICDAALPLVGEWR